MKTPEHFRATFAGVLRQEAENLMNEDDGRLIVAGTLLLGAARQLERLQTEVDRGAAEIARLLRVDHSEHEPEASVAVPASAAAKCRHEFGDNGLCPKCGELRKRKPRATQQPLPGGAP